MPAKSLSQPPPTLAPPSFTDVNIRAALTDRPNRAPNFEAEDRALDVLATELAVNPRNMLQKLVETALVLCQADTAGLSLLETQGDDEVFRWEALAGVFAAHRNSTMPRNASPCGVCIDENATQLMFLPDRCFPALRKDPRFVEALLIPFHHEGRPIGTVWVVTHQYDRKFDREDERIVRTLSAFASAGWQLWKASEMKDEFLALLGHELRNPVAAIRSAMRAVQHPDIDAAGREHALSIVSGQVEDLTRIVDDLLDVSRMDHGKLELIRESVDLAALVRHVVDANRWLMDIRGHAFSLALPDGPVEIFADPVRMRQILTNLLDNAAKYTPDGGEIRLDASVGEDEVRIAVRDTGIGIPAEELDSIFKPFKQSGRFRERSNKGLGLGLALVERLARLHGGSVTASSAGPGQGSEFVVRLPVRVSAAPPKPSQESSRAREITPRRILLVEDNAIVAHVFAMELRLDGHEVRIAANGQAALAAAPGFRPEVVMLDLGLPDMHGHDVARRLREATAPESPVIVVLTGHVQKQDRAGYDYYLVKPVDIEALRNILRTLTAVTPH